MFKKLLEEPAVFCYSPCMQHIEYHKDGTRWAKGEMVDGFYEGYWEWYRKEGTKMRSGYFQKNKQVGEWKTYDKNGKVVKVTNF